MTRKGHSCCELEPVGGFGLEPCGLSWPQARGVGVDGLGGGWPCACGASFSSALSGAPPLERVESFHNSSASGSAACAATQSVLHAACLRRGGGW
eukprot:scaffold38184_cov39-Phaeocystis_antarctica.AAC.1